MESGEDRRAFTLQFEKFWGTFSKVHKKSSKFGLLNIKQIVQSKYLRYKRLGRGVFLK